jgi:3-deoxy-D-manno-octulosonic acid kinase
LIFQTVVTYFSTIQSRIRPAMVNDSRIWGVVPPGFKKIVDARGVRLLVRDDQEPFISIAMCHDSSAREEPGPLEGREKLRSVRLPGGESALIRTYRHGGIFRHMTGRVFFTWPPRPFRELSITEELRRRGIATVEVYGACMEPIWGPLYRGWFITRELKDAQDLWSAFRSGFVRELGVERVLRAVAKSLRSLHRKGVYHRDLNLKNILIRMAADGVQGYVIDFDKAKLFSGTVPRELAKRNLNRLLRSVRKLDPEQKCFSAAQWDQLVSFYQQGDGHDV